MDENENDFPYEIDEKIYQRFEAKYHMIYRRIWDKNLPTEKAFPSITLYIGHDGNF